MDYTLKLISTRMATLNHQEKMPQIACKYERLDGHLEERSTLNIIFNVTYYVESRNVISIDGVSHILPTNVKLVGWTSQYINNITR
jgi:hypothetical protein